MSGLQDVARVMGTHVEDTGGGCLVVSVPAPLAGWSVEVSEADDSGLDVALRHDGCPCDDGDPYMVGTGITLEGDDDIRAAMRTAMLAIASGNAHARLRARR